MASTFSHFLYKSIFQEQNFQDLFKDLLIAYTTNLLNNDIENYDPKYNKLLRYADVLSLSESEEHQNIAQQIVIILSQIYPNENIIKIFKKGVYENVSNFASIDLLNKKKLLHDIDGNFLSDLVYNTHKIQNKIPNSDKSFFDTQLSVFNALECNQYYSFSAPTSMGKTFVITRYILNKLKNNNNKNNFVILVPTRALISEIANKMINEFKDFIGAGKHRIVTSLASINKEDNFIAILTPERLYYSMLENSELEFQYLFVDEAHKISGRDKRSIIYYKILDMLKENNNVRIYFSSPVIPNPDIYLELTNYFSDSISSGHSFTFSPVTQNKIYIDLANKSVSIYNPILNNFQNCSSIKIDCKDKMEALLKLGKGKCNLIYVSSTAKAIMQAIELKNILSDDISQIPSEIQDELEKVAKEIEEKIHNEYYLASLVRKGIAYHIGALPSAIRIKIENLLHLGYIKYCFCTSTLLEGVNVPVDNLFVFDYKKGLANLSTIDAFNLIGRAGRVSLNEFGNVFIIIEDEKTREYFNEVLIQKLPNQTLLPNKAITPKTKKYIVECLLQGKTNLLENGEKYKDKGLTEATYEYAIKCLNMLLHDICTNNKSYIVKDFEKAKAISPKDIINIKNIFKNYNQEDDDINISVKQKISLINAIKNSNINYPSTFDYNSCVEFLKTLSEIFQWSLYEKETLGKGNRLSYYAVILLQWMQGNGLHEIIRRTLQYNKQNMCKIRDSHNRELVKFDNSTEHKNIVINDTMKDIDNIINYKLATYFLRFSETYLKYNKKSLINDWYEYIEYGTSNKLVITLQKHGFSREDAIYLSKPIFNQYISLSPNNISIDKNILNKVSSELQNILKIVMINYPEIFIDKNKNIL